MPFEAGSKECRHLIDAKESLLSAMEALSNINSTDLIQLQIKDIYNKLEQMHDNRKKLNLLLIIYSLFNELKVSKLTFYLLYSFFW